MDTHVNLAIGPSWKDRLHGLPAFIEAISSKCILSPRIVALVGCVSESEDRSPGHSFVECVEFRKDLARQGEEIRKETI